MEAIIITILAVALIILLILHKDDKKRLKREYLNYIIASRNYNKSLETITRLNNRLALRGRELKKLIEKGDKK